jgi:SAM-dependent methyltransferase
MKESHSRDNFRPLSNKPPGTTLTGKLLFGFRIMGDLQIASVLRKLAPWLAMRTGTVLEIGCGAQPYRHLLPSTCVYTGLDWEKAEEHFSYRVPDTVYYDGSEFPFPDYAFDSLFHTEVIEHVYEAKLFLRECRRVLKSGGEMFFTIPFQARYHYIPFDFWRYTPAALEKLLAEAGFTKIEVFPRGNDITVAAYKNLAVIYRWLQSGIVGKLLGVFFSPGAFLCLLVGHVSLLFRIGSPDDCLGYVVKART